jgi:hypothetical protein
VGFVFVCHLLVYGEKMAMKWKKKIKRNPIGLVGREFFVVCDLLCEKTVMMSFLCEEKRLEPNVVTVTVSVREEGIRAGKIRFGTWFSFRQEFEKLLTVTLTLFLAD